MISSRAVRSDILALKELNKGSAVQLHHMKFQSSERNLISIDSTFNIKHDPTNLVFLPSSEALAKETGASIHLGKHTNYVKKDISKKLHKKLDEGLEPRNAIVESNKELFEKLITGKFNLYEKES